MISILEALAVFVAAVSGALAGRQKGMDWFGMFVLGLITGTGGGALRSVLIGDVPPVVFRDPVYVVVALGATVVAVTAGRFWGRIRRVVSVVDAVSLGIFVTIGIRISQAHGLAWWACLCLGVVTATFGGVLRDIARAEVPLIFRREIYATACIAGGLVLLGLDAMGVPEMVGVGVTLVLVTSIRLLAIRYALNESSE